MHSRHYTQHIATNKLFAYLLGTDKADLNIVKDLLKDGADVLVTDQFFLNNSIIIWAIANCRMVCFDALLATLIDFFGTTPELINALLNHVDDCGKTALLLAIAKGWQHNNDDRVNQQHLHMNIAIKSLISHGADVNIADENGNTPLHIAVLRRDPEAISHLIEHGADITKPNKNGIKPLQMLQYNYAEVDTILYSIASVYTLKSEQEFNSSYETIMKIFLDVWGPNHYELNNSDHIFAHEDPAVLKKKINLLCADMLQLFRGNVHKITKPEEINALLVKHDINTPLLNIDEPINRLLATVNHENATLTVLGYSNKVFDYMYQLLKRIFGRDRDSMIQTACSAYKARLCEKECAFTPAYRVFASKENQKRVQDHLIRNRLG